MRYLTSGESHGPQLTAILDGLPAGLTIDPVALDFQMSRRQKGYGRGGRMKIEQDRAEIVSGVRHGKTLGSPITLVVRNKDWENWTEIMHPVNPLPKSLDLRKQRLAYDTATPRPGHADLSGGIKWNHYDLRNVLERASARETAARVAAGSLARQLLEYFGVQFATHVVRIGEVELTKRMNLADVRRVQEITEASAVRCLDSATEKKMIEAIRQAKKKRDSLGGVVELIVRGLPVSLGGFSQWNDRLDGRLAAALMSLHSVKGVEIGMGFRAAELCGSQVHDQIYYAAGAHPAKKDFYRKTNNAGGLEAGITNGEDIVVRIAGKPISTLNQPLDSVDVKTKKPAKAMVERTDNCVIPALGVVCEAAAALVLAEAFLAKFGSDNLEETERNYRAFLDTPY
ncbi:MAG: chorismate synthase [candidate division Zixibacteria bacterium]|nr:chorismate synthase [candidate division Zixibacteria bacterium]